MKKSFIILIFFLAILHMSCSNKGLESSCTTGIATDNISSTSEPLKLATQALSNHSIKVTQRPTVEPASKTI